MEYYVIPDIHGEDILLERMLEKIYPRQESGKIIFLGDYIDRGPNSKRVLDIVMNPPKGWDFVTLMGNHEQMFLDWCSGVASLYDKEILKSFDNNIDPKYIDWIKRTLPYHIQDDNIFAHAAWDPEMPEDRQRGIILLWLRYEDKDAFQSDQYYLTHGHTPRENGPVLAKNRANLDAGAVYYGKLIAGIYKYNVKGPVDFLEVKKGI